MKYYLMISILLVSNSILGQMPINISLQFDSPEEDIAKTTLLRELRKSNDVIKIVDEEVMIPQKLRQ